MNAARFAYAAILALTALAASQQTFAQSVGAHPALRGSAPITGARLDPNTFIVAHPAGLALRAGHANFAHPADLVSRQGAQSLDTNHFLVQPPSPVRWVSVPAGDIAVAAAR